MPRIEMEHIAYELNVPPQGADGDKMFFVQIDPEKCIACGTCAQICPDEVFRLERERGEIPVVMYPDECWHCNACALDCPKHAIELRFPLHYMILKTDAATLNRKAGA